VINEMTTKDKKSAEKLVNFIHGEKAALNSRTGIK